MTPININFHLLELGEIRLLAEAIQACNEFIDGSINPCRFIDSTGQILNELYDDIVVMMNIQYFHG